MVVLCFAMGVKSLRWVGVVFGEGRDDAEGFLFSGSVEAEASSFASSATREHKMAF